MRTQRTDPAPGFGDGALPPTTNGTSALPGDHVRHRLPARALRYRQVKSLLVWLPVAVAVSISAVIFPGLPPILRYALPAAAWLLLAVMTLVVPQISYRLFWYALSPAEIDVQHGAIIIRRTVLPMNRVQHLTVSQGPLAQRFRLSTVAIHTAAGKVDIAALDENEATLIRGQIAELARLSDDV
ncbi:PH domain-containing protein [Nakamurella antarctica]|uniref:PH domain-containing protein n=1 Tax=Nakamurella antarctica TaxID=1902245 RepID=UPI0013DDF778|nr:PH domain-containing protein [Nakamurella antarctica]